MRLTPKNWREFQHYKDRSPPWIKLHKRLLDDIPFACLPVESRALAPFLWLLASESAEGQIEITLKDLVMRLRLPEDEVAKGLAALLAAGFFRDDSEEIASASEPLAERLQSAPRSVSPSPLSESLKENGQDEQAKLPKKPKVTVDWNVPCPDDCDPSVWPDFLSIRKAKNLPLTKLAIERMQTQGEADGLCLDSVIRHCVERGHAGYYADKDNQPNRRNGR